MYTIQTLNKIAAAGTKRFDTAAYTVTDTAENPDAIMVRSAAMHDMTFGSNLLAIARAGAGTNNIPVDRCAEEGICVFNTPGANANAVKELDRTAVVLQKDSAGNRLGTFSGTRRRHCKAGRKRQEPVCRPGN